MKYWIASFLFLTSFSISFACGPWYPYGEETRFSLLYPGWFDNGGLSEFYYSADYIAEVYEFSAENDKNVLDWCETTDNNVSKESVFHVLYGMSIKEIHEAKNEPFINALKYNGKEAYIDYLVFAKTYSHLNDVTNDYWERDETYHDSLRNVAVELAIQKAESTTDEILKRRYAFLALRFQFYSGNEAEVVELYQHYFYGKSELAIDRWAEYHRLHYENNSVERNFRVAQLFASVHSKRRGLWNLFNKNVPKSQILELAKTNQEKANIHAMYMLRERGKSLENIKTIYQLDPKNELLPFFVIREVNKLENWVLGPEITAYEPVIRSHEVNEEIASGIMKERIVEDRLYAKKLLNWITNDAMELNADVKSASIAILSLVVNQPKIGLEHLESQTFSSPELSNWKKNISILLNVKNSKNPKLEDFEIDTLLITDYRFKNALIFAIGRTLEFSGNITESMLLFSHINHNNKYYNSFTWSESNGLAAYNVDFYYDGFDYFDANYSAAEIEKGWNKIEKQGNSFLTEPILNDKLNWLDLIGTKYLREENLKKSIAIWEEIPVEYWSSEARNYDDYLQANPFYADFYSSHEKTKGDTISYTKLEIAQELQKRIKQSKKLKGNARAKVLFEIANCYYNMTQYGNSWMMKRYYWSIHNYNTIYADNVDFNTCVNAKKYYMLAKQATQSSDFQALCLRMAGKCESLSARFNKNYYENNKYYNQLKKEFPNDQEELLTNCFSFERYWESLK
ncbi:hypothetical protein [Brumimicrobium mesophilum]|uniref:hypothetical protein n=1 Tax=Brumimicrobium mesophilum TaxID=392717 RepID=UPI00131D8327|nr:hypothetical protein [Brumimicrobium mesophilum]